MANKTTRAHERRVARRKGIEKRPRRRYILPHTWVFISSRTRDGQFLFSEFDDRDTARVAGLYVVAMRRYGVQVAAHVLMSNHMHCLMRAKRGKRVSLAMQYVKAGIARIVKRKHGTEGPIWGGPFHHQNCLDDDAELDRFRYLISHGNKEGLVADPADWDLPHSVDALTGDGWLTGKAYDKAAAVYRRVRARLTPLTPWMSRPWSEWRDEVKGMVAGLTADCVQARRAQGLEPLPVGHRRLDGTRRRPKVHRRRDHRYRPPELKRSYNRVFRAQSSDAERLLRDAYEARYAAIDSALAASEVLVVHGGGLAVELPDACQWPPFATEAMGDERWAEVAFADILASAHCEAAPAAR